MSQISSELKNAIITIGTHRVMCRVREAEQRRRELLGGEMVQENPLNQSTSSNEIITPTPRYPIRSIEEFLSYDRNDKTPTLASTIAPDTTTGDEREENDRTPTRENLEVTSTAEFLNSFRQTLTSTVREGRIKQARRRSQESPENFLVPTTSSIIAIPEETPEEALLRTSLADSATYQKNARAIIRRMESIKSSQNVEDTDMTNEFDILERQNTKRRRLQ